MISFKSVYVHVPDGQHELADRLTEAVDLAIRDVMAQFPAGQVDMDADWDTEYGEPDTDMEIP